MMLSRNLPGGPSHPTRIGLATVGVVMTLAGSLLLVGLIFISNDSSASSELLFFRLGLVGMALLSMVAQALVIFGVVVLWRLVKAKREG